MQMLEEGRGRGQQVRNGGGRTFRLDGLHVLLQVATAAVQLDGLHVHRQAATAAVQALPRYTDGRPSPSRSRSPSRLATIQAVAALLREQPREDPVRGSPLLKAAVFDNAPLVQDDDLADV